jgi:ankyrin repeat protein
VSAFHGASACFRYLFAAGADYRAGDDAGRTLVHFASAGGSLEILQLIAEGTELDWTRQDKSGNTCVHYAAMFNHLSIMGWLWLTAIVISR